MCKMSDDGVCHSRSMLLSQISLNKNSLSASKLRTSRLFLGVAYSIMACTF